MTTVPTVPTVPPTVPATPSVVASAVRPTDADREAATHRLTQAVAAGQLDLHEFDDRMGAVVRATDHAVLAAQVADLGAPAPDPVARRRDEIREWLAEWRWWAGGAVLLTGIWAARGLVDGDMGEFWPGVPLAVWALVLVAVAIWPAPTPADPAPGLPPGPRG